MKNAAVEWEATTREVCADAGKISVFLRLSEINRLVRPPSAHEKRVSLLPDTLKATILVAQSPGIGGMSDEPTPMSPNPISIAIVVVLASLGVLLIGLAGLVVPGALLIVLALTVFAALKMARQWEQGAGSELIPALVGALPARRSDRARIGSEPR